MGADSVRTCVCDGVGCRRWNLVCSLWGRHVGLPVQNDVIVGLFGGWNPLDDLVLQLQDVRAGNGGRCRCIDRDLTGVSVRGLLPSVIHDPS